jgi:hypothetical protein
VHLVWRLLEEASAGAIYGYTAACQVTRAFEAHLLHSARTSALDSLKSGIVVRPLGFTPRFTMARAGHSGTVVGSAVVVREKYYWPDLQLNIWTIVMLATAGTILGVNAQFMQIQDRMGLGTPWYVLDNALSGLP